MHFSTAVQTEEKPDNKPQIHQFETYRQKGKPASFGLFEPEGSKHSDAQSLKSFIVFILNKKKLCSEG